MKLEISEKAEVWLRQKLAFYAGKQRYPRISLVGMSETGPEFRLLFDIEDSEDARLAFKDLTLLVRKDLLSRIAGFELELHTFYNNNQLHIKPVLVNQACACEGCGECGEHK